MEQQQTFTLPGGSVIKRSSSGVQGSIQRGSSNLLQSLASLSKDAGSRLRNASIGLNPLERTLSSDGSVGSQSPLRRRSLPPSRQASGLSYNELFGGEESLRSLSGAMPRLKQVTVPEINAAAATSGTKAQRSLWESIDLVGGGAASTAASVFRQYDRDNNGKIDLHEMTMALRDLGVMEGVKAREAGRVLQHEFVAADLDQDGLVSFQDFVAYFHMLARYQAAEARAGRLAAKRLAVAPKGWEGNATLRKVFRSYALFGRAHGFGSGTCRLSALKMNSWQFCHLCEDAQLAQPAGNLSKPTIDIIFAKCKAAGRRHLGYKEWLLALAMVAEETGSSFEEVIAHLGVEIPAGQVNAGEAAAAATSAKLHAHSRSIPAQPPRSPRRDMKSKVAAAWKAKKPRASTKQTASALTPSPAAYRCDSMAGSLCGSRAPSESGGPRPALDADTVETLIQQARQDAAAEAESRWQEKARVMASKLRQLEARALVDSPQAASEQPPADMRRVSWAGHGLQTDAPSSSGRAHSQQLHVPADAPGWAAELVDGIRSELNRVHHDFNTRLANNIAALEARIEARQKQGGGKGLAEEEGAGDAGSRLAELEQAVGQLRSQIGADSDGVPLSRMPLELRKRLNEINNKVDTLAARLSDMPMGALLNGEAAHTDQHALERHSRLEGALMKVAARVDVLDRQLKVEQESSLRALEAILAQPQDHFQGQSHGIAAKAGSKLQ